MRKRGRLAKTIFQLPYSILKNFLYYSQSIGHVSGGHINPAVTLSMLVVGKCSVLKTICYIVMQCAGATLGFFLLMVNDRTISSTVSENHGHNVMSTLIPVTHTWGGSFSQCWEHRFGRAFIKRTRFWSGSLCYICIHIRNSLGMRWKKTWHENHGSSHDRRSGCRLPFLRRK